MKRVTMEEVLASALVYAASVNAGPPSAEVMAKAAFAKTANAWAKGWRCQHCKQRALPGASLCTKHAAINRIAATKRRSINKAAGLTSGGTIPKR